MTLEATLLRANTHGVANTGLLACVAALGVHIVSSLVADGALHPALALRLTIDNLDALTFPALTSGAILAYFGRPKSVPSNPTATEMEAISKSPSASAQVAAIGARATSDVGADAPRPSRSSAAITTVSGTAGGSLPMSFLQDLEIGEEILGDVVAFAGGKPVKQSGRIGALNYTATVTVLPNGPSGTPFQVLSGGAMAIIGMVFADYAAFSTGQPIQIAEKIGSTWYGTAVAVTPVAETTPAAPAAA